MDRFCLRALATILLLACTMFWTRNNIRNKKSQTNGARLHEELERVVVIHALHVAGASIGLRFLFKTIYRIVYRSLIAFLCLTFLLLIGFFGALHGFRNIIAGGCDGYHTAAVHCQVGFLKFVNL